MKKKSTSKSIRKGCSRSMDKNLILDFIREKGYRTRSEIGINFGKEDQEVIDIHLSASIERGAIKCVEYAAGNRHEKLYYMPYHKEG